MSRYSSFKFFIICMMIPFLATAQTREDFYDSYDYNLRNYKESDQVDREVYKEYTIPPQFKKPPLLNPKNVQLPQDPLLSMPMPGGIRSPGQVQQNQIMNQTPGASNMPINPLTGQVNMEAIRKNQDAAKKKEEKKKALRSEEHYDTFKETKGQRFEIIFFLTLPYALLLTYTIATLITAPGVRPGSFQKTISGSYFVFFGSVSIAAGNAYRDMRMIEEYKKNKKDSDRPLFSPDPMDDFSSFQNDLGPKKDRRLEFLLGATEF